MKVLHYEDLGYFHTILHMKTSKMQLHHCAFKVHFYAHFVVTLCLYVH